MVDDPYTFGQIAAANALSDIYAMGECQNRIEYCLLSGNWDLNIRGRLCWVAEKSQRGGGVLAGGHSIADTDVKYGLSVMGTIHPDKVFANNGCRAGMF